MERKEMYWSDEESDTDVSGIIEDDVSEEMEKLEISIDESFEYMPTDECKENNNFATLTNQVEPCMNVKEETEDPGIAMELQTTVPSTPKMETEEIPYASLPVVANRNIKEESGDHGIITEPKISVSSTQKRTHKPETIEIPGTSIPIAERNTVVESEASGVEKKKPAPILRRSARLSRMQVQPLDEKPKVSETEEEIRLQMSNCYVVLTKLNVAKYNKNQRKSRAPLRRSLRNIQQVYKKENEDDVDDNAALPPLRKSQAKKIARVPKAKTPQPSQHVTRSISTIASVKDNNVERIKKKLRKLDDMNLDKQLASVMEKAAKNIANLKAIQLRRRSMVHEQMNVDENQEDTVSKSVNVSKTTKPRLTRKLKNWFLEDSDDEENITIHAKPSRRSLRTRTCDTDIILPQPGQRVTRSMTRRLAAAAASQTAGRAGFPKRRCSIHTTCFNYNAMY